MRDRAHEAGGPRSDRATRTSGGQARGPTRADSRSSAFDISDDPAAIDLHVQTVRAEVHRVGSAGLYLAHEPCPGRLPSSFGEIRRIHLADGEARTIARARSASLGCRLGKCRTCPQGREGREAPSEGACGPCEDLRSLAGPSRQGEAEPRRCRGNAVPSKVGFGGTSGCGSSAPRCSRCSSSGR